MAHFFGSLKGNRGEATRLGTANSGLHTVSASWQGAVEVYISHDSVTGKDIASVFLIPWYGNGIKQTLYVGPVGGGENKKDEPETDEDTLSRIGKGRERQ